jgi:hypothetical protein
MRHSIFDSPTKFYFPPNFFKQIHYFLKLVDAPFPFIGNGNPNGIGSTQSDATPNRLDKRRAHL